jgi:D-alanyl-D-alanine carboxypeptidase/D-alanyl-D-alanine-endopeptidase (penicillin-binding protein 4)
VLFKYRYTPLALALAALAAGCAKPAAVPRRSAEAAEATADSFEVRRDYLAARIDSLLADTLLAQAQLGLYIVSVEPRRDVYANHFQQLLVPASTNKLFVTALAYRRLGASHRFRTVVLGDSIDALGRLKGPICLKGSGDPDLEALSFRLKSRGLERVAGTLVVDPSAFDTTQFGPGWMWDEGPYAYNAPISALSVNHNTFEVGVSAGGKPGDRLRVEVKPKTGYLSVENRGLTAYPGVRKSLKVSREAGKDGETVTVTGVLAPEDSPQYLVRSIGSPALYCGRLFREALARQGIKVLGKTVVGPAPDSLEELASVSSRPLYSIVQDMNKNSDNFTAEMLFRYLTVREPPQPENAAANGNGPLTPLLDSLGFLPGTYRVVDGSGLSRYNLCSAQQLVKVLLALYQDPLARPELLVALPVAGVDGTLWNRMNGQDRSARVRAKTGTMTGVSSLAGFAYGRDDRCYCFAMIFNNYTARPNAVRAIQDRILEELIAASP